MKLYEIPLAMRFALENVEIDEETGEILNVDELNAIEEEASAKIEATAFYLREIDSEASAVEAEGKHLLERAKSIQKKREYIRSLLEPALREFNGKVKTSRVTVYLRKSSSVVVDEGIELGEAYLTKKVTISPNKKAIKDALTLGIDVPGCRIEERESVQIR